MAKRFARICQNESVFGNKSKMFFHAYLLNTKNSVKRKMSYRSYNFKGDWKVKTASLYHQGHTTS